MFPVASSNLETLTFLHSRAPLFQPIRARVDIWYITMLVISPLLVLMEDQVSFLLKHNVTAANVSAEQDEKVLRNIELGKYRLV